jgi:DNA-binding NarL/FixJ family response regulator
VNSGGIYLSDAILQKIIDYYCQSDHDIAGQEVLTGREKEILLLVRDGLTNVEIARRFGISHRTVEAHRFHAMKKLHLHNQSELVAYFMEGSGLAHAREKS